MAIRADLVKYLAAICLLGGCGEAAVDVSQRESSLHVKPPPALRLTRERFDEIKRVDRPALPIRLRMQDGSAVGDPADGNVLRVSAGERPTGIQLNVDVDAEEYNALQVRMRLDSGERCVLGWTGDVVPRVDRRRSVFGFVIADNEFHTYTFPLTSAEAETWCGRIRQLFFVPAERPATIEIESIKLLWRVPEGPTRITLNNETHEALFGTQPPWSVVVPPEAVFEVHMGMLTSSWKHGETNGVRFEGTITTESGHSAVLVDETLDPLNIADDRNWIGRRVSLGEFAGERAEINLRIDNLGDSRDDFAYWGNPILFSRTSDEDVVPVILLSCDTLRADHVSCYGYSRKTTPYLDKFAEESVLFETVISAEPWTPPAHASMLTGLYPKHHRVHWDVNLPEEVVTLPELLSEAGYLTAGFTGHGTWMLPWRGFSHGFDVYSTPDLFRDFFETYELVRSWMDEHATPATFLFFHNYDIHSKFAPENELPYFPVSDEYLHFARQFDPAPALERAGQKKYLATDLLQAFNSSQISPTDRERDYIIALYDDCIRMVDLGLNGLFDELRQRNLYDSAMIIVTGDHGESFGEHGLFLHREVYESCCRVPLIIKFPHGRFKGRRITGIVQLIDIFPTILDVLGLTVPVETDGRSLIGLLEGTTDPRKFAYIKRLDYRAVRSSEWKLVRDNLDNISELYNLSEDPDEQEDMFADSPPVLADLTSELDQFHRVPTAGWHIAFEGSLSGVRMVSMDFSCRTADRFEASDLLFTEGGKDRYLQSPDGHTLVGTVALMPQERKELVFRTFSPESKVMLRVGASEGFAVKVGTEFETVGTRWETVLEPADGDGYPEPDDSEMAPADLATVKVWYEPPSVKASPAKALSEEHAKHLRSLGYVR